MGGFVSLFTYFASVKLHARSMQKIFFAVSRTAISAISRVQANADIVQPMSFFHSTPTG